MRKSLSDRFYEKVDNSNIEGCWLWTGAKKKLGYGVIGLGSRIEGIAQAHRVSYELNIGRIPYGLSILHSCDNPSCVNPKHLRAGTLSDNMQDCVSRKRNFIPDNRGELATWSKLKADSVRHIKLKLMSGVAYAKMYGVHRSTIYQIWKGNNWKSI